MAKLPPASTEAEMVRVQRGPRWAEDGGDFIRWDGDEEVDLDAAAGGA